MAYSGLEHWMLFDPTRLRDQIPDGRRPVKHLDLWRQRRAMAALFVNAISQRGGEATLLNLLQVGVLGNTHLRHVRSE